MPEHTHRTLVEGCYRCDLNLDEMSFRLLVRPARDAPHLYDIFVDGVRRDRVAEDVVIDRITRYVDERFA